MITVFTPTFNREHTLTKLYISLCNQTCYDFEWLIVDDGSTDDTEELIDSFIKERKFEIRYLKKKNEGKHVAINYGVKHAKGDWFFIVDSDDYLTENAIETVSLYAKQVKDDSGIACVVGLRGNKSSQVLSNVAYKDAGSWMQQEYIDASVFEYRGEMKITGDRAEVIKTDVLLKFPFPQFEGEVFLSESCLWYGLAKAGYRCRWFNKIIYITEYLEDGLTNHSKENHMKCWQGTCYTMNFLLGCKEIRLIERSRYAVNFFRYGFYGKKSFWALYKDCTDKLLALPAAVVAKFSKVGERK